MKDYFPHPGNELFHNNHGQLIVWHQEQALMRFRSSGATGLGNRVRLLVTNLLHKPFPEFQLKRNNFEYV